MLWMHWRGIIIGNIRDLKVEGAEITGEPYFDEVRDESKLAKQQWDKGTLKMCSPYFEIVESSDDPVLLKPGQTRPTITRCRLMEVSMVDMGGNDDNIVMLSYRGDELKLATGEDCTALPLLKTDGGQTPPSNNSKTKETMNADFKAIALKLGLPETAVSPVLLGMGLCSAASNLFSGCLAEKGGLKPLPVFFAAQVLLFAVLPLLLVNRWLGLTGLFAMGLLMYLLNTPVQVHSLGLAEAEYPAAASLCASVQPVSYNFGIAAGSFAGSLVQDAWGLRLLGVPAAVFALLSLWQCRGLLRSIQRGKTSR